MLGSSASVPVWSDRPRALAPLPRFLFDRSASAWRYILFAWPLVSVPSLLLAWLATRIAPDLPGPDLGNSSALVTVLGVVVFSPIAETLLMSAPVHWLNRWRGPVVAVTGSAILWAVAHSLLAARWGLVIWWPFLIFSIAYLTWRPRGYWRAIGVVSTIHALNNAGPIAALLIVS